MGVGGTKILWRLQAGVSIFYTHKKIPLSRYSPAALDAPFARFAPAALKSFRHPGGGVPIFDSDSEGGYQNFAETPMGVRIFYGHFSRKVPPSPNKQS